MPALPAVSNTLRVDLHHGVGTDANALVRLYLSYTGGPPSNADCASLATAIRTAYGTNLKSLMSTFNDLSQTIVTDLSSSTGASGVDITTVAGTRAGTPLDAGTAALVNHRIARRYRGGKPRSYFPWGIASDLSGPSGWGTTFIANVNTGWAAFRAAVIGASAGTTVVANQVNVSYYNGFHNVTGPTGRAKARSTVRGSVPTPDVITAGICNQLPASQRRRNRP